MAQVSGSIIPSVSPPPKSPAWPTSSLIPPPSPLLLALTPAVPLVGVDSPAVVPLVPVTSDGSFVTDTPVGPDGVVVSVGFVSARPLSPQAAVTSARIVVETSRILER